MLRAQLWCSSWKGEGTIHKRGEIEGEGGGGGCRQSRGGEESDWGGSPRGQCGQAPEQPYAGPAREFTAPSSSPCPAQYKDQSIKGTVLLWAHGVPRLLAACSRQGCQLGVALLEELRFQRTGPFKGLGNVCVCVCVFYRDWAH